MSAREPDAATVREQLASAHCVESFSILVQGATAPTGERAVVLAVLPPGERGWTFPLPIEEARLIAALLTEKADAS